MRKREPDVGLCDWCERPEDYCNCPVEGDRAWCPFCGWSIIDRIEQRHGRQEAICALCGEDMTELGKVVTHLPHDLGELVTLIKMFLAYVQDGRDFELDLPNLAARKRALPLSWKQTHASDARALMSAVGLLTVALRSLVKRLTLAKRDAG